MVVNARDGYLLDIIDNFEQYSFLLSFFALPLVNLFTFLRSKNEISKKSLAFGVV